MYEINEAQDCLERIRYDDIICTRHLSNLVKKV